MEQINLLVKERKTSLNRPVIVPKLDDEMCPVRYCYGKLRESLAIAIISYVAKKLDGIKSLPKEVLVAAMIERYRNRKGHQEDKYYEAMVNNLIAA